MENLLEIEGISKAFGGLKAIDQCSFAVKKNTITGLIGPNGAGKTTMFNVISGYLKPDEGNIYLNDENIVNTSAFERANKGIGRSFQAIRLFPELSVLDNIIIAFKENKDSFWDCFRRYKKNQKILEDRAMRFLEEFNLEEKANLKAYELSYGQKKLIEIIRIKAREPNLILLDEPTAGINPTLIKKVTKEIKQFKKEGKTILIVEHNMPFIMEICEEIIVMDRGQNLAVGKPEEIQTNKEVLKAYLGG